MENPPSCRRAVPWVAFVPFCLLALTFVALARSGPTEVPIAAFATRLSDRTGSQRHNARLAADALDGAVIPPGGIFSYNRRVRSWSLDQGYVRAPVSYDGDMVLAFGGGVCQTSSTLYNAALLAGLEIVERHPHIFAPHYVAPGRDAAVAYPNIDLRLRNPYSFPVRLRVRADRERLEVGVWGAKRPEIQTRLASRMLAVAPAPVVTRPHTSSATSSPRILRTLGNTGFRVVTDRIFLLQGRAIRRERLADDTYRAAPQVTTYLRDD